MTGQNPFLRHLFIFSFITVKNERKSYYETFLGLDHLQERYDYLQEYGFQVYGAVVTGPVKELLKLKDVEEIQGVQLGKLEYWNWDN